MKDFQWKKIIQRSKLNYKLWMAKANYSYMNSFGSLNEVKELLPFTLDRAANRALEIIHGEQSATHMDTQSNIQYTAEMSNTWTADHYTIIWRAEQYTIHMDTQSNIQQSNTWTAEHYTINMESRAIHMDRQKMSREREIENVSGEPQVNFIISASSKVHVVSLPNTAALSSKEM